MIRRVSHRHRGSWVGVALALHAMAFGMAIPGPGYLGSDDHDPPETPRPERTRDGLRMPQGRQTVRSLSARERNAKKRARRTRERGRK